MSIRPPRPVNSFIRLRTADELQLITTEDLDGMNKVAGLSWWVVGILIVIVVVALMLANR